MFREYKHQVFVNGRWFHKVLVDSHVIDKHGPSMSDQLVLRLVSLLHLQFFESEAQDENGFEYFVNSDLLLEGKAYRLVWLTPPDKSYIGVRTAFRRRNHGR